MGCTQSTTKAASAPIDSKITAPDEAGPKLLGVAGPGGAAKEDASKEEANKQETGRYVDPAKLRRVLEEVASDEPAEEEKAAATDAAEDLLATALETEAGRAELKALFETLDQNSDGKVTRKEWGKQLAANKEMIAKYFGGCSLPALGRAFRRIDADGDGALVWDEFVVAATGARAAAQTAAMLATETGQAELKALFETIDKDADGKVTSKEWGRAVGANKELMAKYFGGSSPGQIGRAFKRIDIDGNGTLSWDEFLSTATEANDPATQEAPKEAAPAEKGAPREAANVGDEERSPVLDEATAPKGGCWCH